MSDQIVTIRPEKTIMTKQLLPNFVGISQESAGSTGLAMNIVIIPPGAAAAPHYHDGFETAIYILEGSVRTLYGPGLKQETINHAGEFMFIPANVPHQPINMSATEPAKALIARNDPNEQESVVPYDPEQ
ncbi:MAG: cupin domain-containing protein [Anaerolineae bacterium]|nr:cupin domain-containing protein [Anaerolineae bacterium]MCO5186841.1 cupin domain-containing protein [Anaerolineae bacterium]MCO5195826.1 cupin domain-containing protein [Anaerolineae bacterium]MCO5196591.1 cupin domain-containing protein [Anaerolineae bacterium]MCO5206584.1 cupin domain-containing protein [Anaerolineae bacterium]